MLSTCKLNERLEYNMVLMTVPIQRDADIPHLQLLAVEAIPGHGEGGGARGPAIAINEEWMFWPGRDCHLSCVPANTESEEEHPS